MNSPSPNTPPPSNHSPDSPKLQLDPRDMLVILLGILTGVVTGLLTVAAGAVLAQAVLAGLAAFGTALYAFDRWIR